jgi:hypothetical protein
MSHVKIFLVIAGITCLALQCDKKGTPPQNNEPVPEDTLYANDTFLRYWYFPKGSWWVYERMDTNANVYDTVTILNQNREMKYNPRYADYMIESFNLNLRHSSAYFTKINKGRPLIQTIDNPALNPNIINSIGHKSYFGYNSFFSWPIDSILIGQKSLDRSMLIDKNKIRTPFGKIGNTIHLKFDNNNHIWLSKNIGFIKYIHSDSSVWELVNYEIKK